MSHRTKKAKGKCAHKGGKRDATAKEMRAEINELMYHMSQVLCEKIDALNERIDDLEAAAAEANGGFEDIGSSDSDEVVDAGELLSDDFEATSGENEKLAKLQAKGGVLPLEEVADTAPVVGQRRAKRKAYVDIFQLYDAPGRISEDDSSSFVNDENEESTEDSTEQFGNSRHSPYAGPFTMAVCVRFLNQYYLGDILPLTRFFAGLHKLIFAMAPFQWHDYSWYEQSKKKPLVRSGPCSKPAECIFCHRSMPLPFVLEKTNGTHGCCLECLVPIHLYDNLVNTWQKTLTRPCLMPSTRSNWEQVVDSVAAHQHGMLPPSVQQIVHPSYLV